jgi:hypothetical protein
MDGAVNEHVAKARREHLERLRAKAEQARPTPAPEEETVMDDRDTLMANVIVADHRMILAMVAVMRDYLNDPAPDFEAELRKRLDHLESLAREHLACFERLGIS